MSDNISMQFCSACQLYRICIAETRTSPLRTETGFYCVEHRIDYGDWRYAITMRHGRLVIVASGMQQTTITAYPESLDHTRRPYQGW